MFGSPQRTSPLLLALGALSCVARQNPTTSPSGGSTNAAEGSHAEPPALPPAAPVVVEAESGDLGADFTMVREEGDAETIEYVSVQSNGAGGNPGSAARVIRYRVKFSAAGDYDLYARIRVGPKAAEDDSLFFARGFGEPDPTTDADWALVNNLGQVGHSDPDAVVNLEGTPRAGTWSWVNLSTFFEAPRRHGFAVPDGQLEQTFAIGAREDGLSIDKLAFGPARISHTVADLTAGRAGRWIPPQPSAPPFTPAGPALAHGQPKFLGSCYSAAQAPNFIAYFNQVTPENAGKWGSVEAQRDQMSWSELDRAYELAKKHGLPFRFHVLVWGNQQPAWIEELPPEEQLEEIDEWMSAVAERYDAIDMLEVVNEPLHDPPNQPGDGGGNYLEALGGKGESGWQWVVTAFRMARKHFPGTQLMLNEYSVVNQAADARRYVEIIELLKADKLIDVVGIQGHSFETRGDRSVMAENLDLIASAGLPIVITELDVDGATDEKQQSEYQRIFPLFWEHPAVVGITLWGYRPGMWRTAQGANLALRDGAERPALEWLRKYLSNPKTRAAIASTTGKNAPPPR